MPETLKYDIICVGAGIMSTTYALLAKQLNPNLNIAIFERLTNVALESTAAWNNAGTGHSAYCELNYTPEINGQINIDKAIAVCKQFELSKSFWSYLVEKNYILAPELFIKSVPHHSWVKGEENVNFLKKRFNTLKEHFMFKGMKFTEDKSKMSQWFPLIMDNREENEIMAATRMEEGVEMNFEVLTREFARILREQYDTPIQYRHQVLDIDPDETIDWTVIVKDLETDEKKYFDSEHVFIGAGGGALPLLQKVEIKEKDGYGGFPVSGQWLVYQNQEIINQHLAKVYSKAEVGSPPMSTPHLDTRFINGKQELLFGPFAGFSTKFLKEGSYADLPKSIKWDNIPSMWGAFWHNLDLTKYLIQEVTKTHEDRMEDLRVFMKNAKSEDWKLLKAGQRVQIIERDEENGGTLEFGTKVISSLDGKITALLGASPGASTAAAVMMEVIEKSIPESLHSEYGNKIMHQMMPLYFQKENIDPELYLKYRRKSDENLQLELHL